MIVNKNKEATDITRWPPWYGLVCYFYCMPVIGKISHRQLPSICLPMRHQ